MPTNWTTPGQIGERWRPLTEAQAKRAVGLIGMIERTILARWPDLSERIDAGKTDIERVRDVVAALAYPVLELPDGVPMGAKSWQNTSGSETETITLADATGGMFLRFADWMTDALDSPSEATDRSSSNAPLWAAPQTSDRFDRVFPNWTEGEY